LTRRKLLNIVASATCAFLTTAFAQKAATPKTPDKYALAEEHTRELLLLMDTDKNGKISKQEWMKFMEAEFDRLDQNKTGQLDPKLLQQKLAKHARADTGK
jgi:CRISPR/Cas system-associated endonuclease Cas3-HD